MTRVPVDRAQAHTADRGGEAAETCLPTTPPPEVRSRFVLAAARMVDVWLHAGQVRVSTEDFRIVRDFLERDGWTVEELPGVCVRLRSGGVPSAEMTREAAALVALRRLVAPSEWRRRALRIGGSGLPVRLRFRGSRRFPRPKPAAARDRLPDLVLQLPSDARAQRAAEFGVAPRIAEAIRDAREHALAGEQQLGHFAEREP